MINISNLKENPSKIEIEIFYSVDHCYKSKNLNVDKIETVYRKNMSMRKMIQIMTPKPMANAEVKTV